MAPPIQLPINEAQRVLRIVQASAANGTLAVTRHAREQQNARNVRSRDIAHAIKGAQEATYQPDRGTWLIKGGVDVDGEPLVVVVDVKTTPICIVTVF